MAPWRGQGPAVKGVLRATIRPAVAAAAPVSLLGALQVLRALRQQDLQEHREVRFDLVPQQPVREPVRVSQAHPQA